MKGDIGKVMHAGMIHTIPLTIQHVRNPSEGMPIALLPRSESPVHVIPGDPGTDVSVFFNVSWIVEGDVSMIFDGYVDSYSTDDQCDDDRQNIVVGEHF